MEPTIVFETRNVNGVPLQVAIYSGRIYRVDDEDAAWYVKQDSPAPFKYFTATEEEAKSGYSKHGQILRTYRTARPLVLVNMYDLATRNAILELMDQAEHPHMLFSFPLMNADTRFSRRSEEGYTHHNYGVSTAICRLFATHGIDGYYIERAAFHSEIMICQTSLIPDVLQYEGQKRVSTKQILRKRTRTSMEPNAVNLNVDRTIAPAEPENESMREFPSYMLSSPPRPKRLAMRSQRRRTRRTRRNRH
jgi:hypothetical protein